MPGPNPAVHKSKFVDDALIAAFLATLEKTIKVDALIVFGSRARDDALFSSDYDVAVISDGFKPMPRHERIFFLLNNWDADVALEAVAFTPEEFDSATGLLVWDILEEGIAFKDTGAFARRKARHAKDKEHGTLAKVEGGWKFASEQQLRQR